MLGWLSYCWRWYFVHLDSEMGSRWPLLCVLTSTGTLWFYWTYQTWVPKQVGHFCLTSFVLNRSICFLQNWSRDSCDPLLQTRIWSFRFQAFVDPFETHRMRIRCSLASSYSSQLWSSLMLGKSPISNVLSYKNCIALGKYVSTWEE